MRDDEADTELGQAADAPTEFREPVPVEVQHAWSVDDATIPDVVASTRASWGRAAAIAAVIAVVTAAVAGGIVVWHRHRGQSATPVTASTAPVPEVSAPEKTPWWHLNGSYRVDIRNPEGMIYHLDGTSTSMSDFRLPIRSNWVAYKTECNPDGCTARSVLLDDVTHQTAAKLDPDLARHWRGIGRWDGTEWTSAGNGPHGGSTDTLLECDRTGKPDTVETWMTLSPLPDGSFKGISHRYFMTNECGMGGDKAEVPITAVRIGDIPDGIRF